MKKRDEYFQQILALWNLEWIIHFGENQIVPVFIVKVIQLFGIETFQADTNIFTIHSLPGNRI